MHSGFGLPCPTGGALWSTKPQSQVMIDMLGGRNRLNKTFAYMDIQFIFELISRRISGLHPELAEPGGFHPRGNGSGEMENVRIPFT